MVNLTVGDAECEGCFWLSEGVSFRARSISNHTHWVSPAYPTTVLTAREASGFEGSLVALTDVGVSLADALYEGGFFSIDEIRIASVEDLMQVRDMDEEKAQALISAARQAVLDAEAEDEEDVLQETQENNSEEPSGDLGETPP